MDVGALNHMMSNVRKLVKNWWRTEGDDYDRVVLLSMARINPRITEFEGFCDQAILEYMKRVKELDPNYDAGDVKNVIEFRYRSPVVSRFLEKRLDLKLKLAVVIGRAEDEDRFVQNGLGHLIHHLNLDDGYALRSQLQSVRKLLVTRPSSLRSTLALLPNVEDVAIRNSKADEAADPDIFQSVLGIKNLKRFDFYDFRVRAEANVRTFQLILMKPSLKHLAFERHPFFRN